MRILGQKKAGNWATLVLAGCLLLLLVSPVFASDTSPTSQALPSEGRWAPNVKVNDDSGTAVQGWPSIAVDRPSNAYVAWDDWRNGWPHTDIYFSKRPPGGSWSVSSRVNEEELWTTVRQREPSIAVTPDGDAHALWMDDRSWPIAYDIYSSFLPSGGSWGTNLRVNDDPGLAYQSGPSLAVDTTGNAYAVWADGRVQWWNYIYFSERPSGGGWSGNVRVDDIVPVIQESPSIAVDTSGNLYVVWTDTRVFTDYCCRGDIYFSYRPAGGSWGASVRVDDAPPTTTQWEPSIAVDPYGNAYAVWEDHRRGDPDIRFSYRAAGGSWTPSIQINDDQVTAEQAYPSIAVDSAGNASAVWQDRREGNWDIYFSHRPAGGSWSTNIRVNDDSFAANQTRPEIAVDPAGKAYAVWEDPRNGDPDIYFSYWPSYLMGGLVWYDYDQDGIHDSGEPGVEAIDVVLYNNGTCAPPSSTTGTTAPDGSYAFTIEVPGTYCVEFPSIPEDWTITLQNQGADDTADSDADPASRQIPNIVVPPARDVLHEDVGLYAAEEFVPELGTLTLLAGGLLGLAGYAKLRLHR